MRKYLLILVALCSAKAQEPHVEYQSHGPVSGVIRVLGKYHMGTLRKYWEDGFRKYHPGIRFEEKLLGTANAIAGLYLETADIALMGREILPIESIAYRRVLRKDPIA